MLYIYHNLIIFSISSIQKKLNNKTLNITQSVVFGPWITKSYNAVKGIAISRPENQKILHCPFSSASIESTAKFFGKSPSTCVVSSSKVEMLIFSVTYSICVCERARWMHIAILKVVIRSRVGSGGGLLECWLLNTEVV